MLKRFLKISIILIIFFYENFDYNIHSYLIDNNYKSDVRIKVDNIGYIEIERLNIKREIKLGINDFNMINYVTMNNNCNSFECDNIVLAGHAVKNIFGNLKNIKIKDIIKLNNGLIYKYEVTSIDIVDKKDLSIIDNSNLILITCYDLNRRIIVKAKRI